MRSVTTDGIVYEGQFGERIVSVEGRTGKTITRGDRVVHCNTGETYTVTAFRHTRFDRVILNNQYFAAAEDLMLAE